MLNLFNPSKHRYCFFILVCFFILTILSMPRGVQAQVVPGSTLDLRSVSGQRWWFRPGDSPVIKGKYTSDDDELSGKTLKRHELAFTWAQPDLSKEELSEWYDNFDIQIPWFWSLL